MAGTDTGARALPAIAIAFETRRKMADQSRFRARIRSGPPPGPGNLHQCQLRPQMLLKGGDQFRAMHAVMVGISTVQIKYKKADVPCTNVLSRERGLAMLEDVPS
jgi:hypothetical protein